MKKYILQHTSIHQQDILYTSRAFNQPYAEKTGFEYIPSNLIRRCPKKPLNYEKIGYLKEMLPKLDEGSLVVWLDADTIILKDESFENALPTGGLIGMVRMLHGVDCKQPHNWWNIGVTCMRNIKPVRDFFDKVHERNDENDEFAFMRQLKEQCWYITDGIQLSSLDYKWNCWSNNRHMCPDPNVVSWHGIRTENKLSAMKDFISKLKRG